MSTQISEQRPWGSFKVLHDTEKYKVKEITIKPGQCPSYQYHYKRNEEWIVVSGKGVAIINDQNVEIGANSVVKRMHVEKGDKHQIINNGTEDLIFVEVQTGEYFGEDDIVRLDDKYGRV